MKNASTTTAIMDMKTLEYLSTMSPLLTKKTLYAMTLLKGDETLSDSPFAEVRHIATIYDGYIILPKAARDLASKLAKAFAQKNPHVFMTKKEIEHYTNVWYRKLHEAVGMLGFEYVLDELRKGKAYVKQPDSGISEKDLLRALRWQEQREGVNKESSNIHHRKKGLELLGFIGLEDELLDCSFIIANLYEMVTPNNDKTCEAPVAEQPKEDIPAPELLSVREMKVHFIQKAELILKFYGTKLPVVPTGYSAEELDEGSVVLELAAKGLLKDSEAVMAYKEGMKVYLDVTKKMYAEFTLVEQDVIIHNPEMIQALVANQW